MDCAGCGCYRYQVERLTEDAYFSTPGEAACADGAFWERHLCARMLAALKNCIRAGTLTTEGGR
jgi:hypothetical protein